MQGSIQKVLGDQTGIVFTDAEGKIFWANEAYLHMTGYDLTDIIGKTPIDVSKGPLSNRESLGTMVTHFLQQLSFVVEGNHYRKDGSFFYARVVGESVKDPSGKLLQYFATVQNLDNEKSLAQKEAEIETRFRIALEKIGDNVWEHDFVTNKTIFSNADINVIGYSSDTQIDNTAIWWNAVYEEDRKLLEEVDRKYKQALADHHVLEYRIRDKEGKIRWVLDRGVVIEKAEDGKPLRIIGTHTDITETKSTEQALQNKEEKYRSIIANMNLGLIEVDNEDRILYANQSFCTMSGYSEEELMGKIAATTFLRDDNVQVVTQKNQQRIKGISDAYEIAAKNKDGQPMWWLVSGAPRYDKKGEVVGSIGIHLDITQQKKLETELVSAREQAEFSSRAKQVFLANMSHEIRTPMNAILGMGHQLQKTLLNEKQRFYLDAMNTSAENLLVIINDILDISKIEAGRLTLECIGFHIPDAIKRATQVMQHKAEEKGLELITHIDPSVADILLGDPYRLNQVLLNLISNAIKFTIKGKVTVNCTVLSAKKDEQVLQFTIIDEGIGMEKDFLDNLFQSFSQEDLSITRRYGGTGLGMAISKQLVELMNGNIVAESEKNKGTVIRLTIPFSIGIEADVPVLKADRADDLLLKHKKILLVEDNDMNRLVATTVLANYDCLITECRNGAEAVDLVKQEFFDLVLMDIQMPVMDGIEATRVIRHELRSDIPIIALSANAIKGENLRYFDAGMNDFISKPFTEEILISTIAKWLGGKEVQNLTMEEPLEEKETPLYTIDYFMEVARGDMGFIKKMLELFINSVPAMVKEMSDAYDKRDMAETGRLAHKVKPNLDNMQIASITQTIRNIEMMGKAGTDSPQLSEMILQVQTVVDKVVAQIRKDHGIL